MNTPRRILALATALGLTACNAPGEPAARNGSSGQDTSAAHTTLAPHVNPPETSSGY